MVRILKRIANQSILIVYIEFVIAKGIWDTKRTEIKSIEVDKENGNTILIWNKLRSRTNNL